MKTKFEEAPKRNAEPGARRISAAASAGVVNCTEMFARGSKETRQSGQRGRPHG
jgi:hypothetical protein